MLKTRNTWVLFIVGIVATVAAFLIALDLEDRGKTALDWFKFFCCVGISFWSQARLWMIGFEKAMDVALELPETYARETSVDCPSGMCPLDGH
jgi:hypothetical protein